MLAQPHLTQNPQLTQRLDALDKANQARTRTANLKKRIKACEVDPRDLIREVDNNVALRSTTVHDFLTWIPGFGKCKATAVTKKIQCSSTLLLRDLSPVNRGHMIVYLNRTLNAPTRKQGPFKIKPIKPDLAVAPPV